MSECEREIAGKYRNRKKGKKKSKHNRRQNSIKCVNYTTVINTINPHAGGQPRNQAKGTRVPRRIITERGQGKWRKEERDELYRCTRIIQELPSLCSTIFSANLIKILLANVQLGKQAESEEGRVLGAGTTYWDLWLLWWCLIPLLGVGAYINFARIFALIERMSLI